MVYYSGRRAIRTKDFEQWYFYKSGYTHIDTVLIFFNAKSNDIYLVTTHKSINKEQNYLSIVVNLVHDLETEFNFNIQKINIDGINDDDKIDDMINDEVEKIKGMKLKNIPKSH